MIPPTLHDLTCIVHHMSATLHSSDSTTSNSHTTTSNSKPSPASTPITSLPAYNFPSSLSTTDFGTAARSSLFSLRPNTTFLNHGSYGAVPLLVQQYQQQLNQRVESHPDLWFRFHSYQLVRAAAERFAEFIGATSGEEVVFVTNATSAVNAVLSSLQLQAGDVIYHSRSHVQRV